MEPNNNVDFILKECKIYYGDALISSEIVLKDFAKFLCLHSDDRIRTVLHTGSVCFDVLSFVYSIFLAMLKNTMSNDSIVESLKIGDMVIFGNKRQRWLGISDDNGHKIFKLEEEGSGKNGACITTIDYNIGKSKVRPYYGDSEKTGGTGVKSSKTNRNDFLSKLLAIDISEVPSSFDFCLVVLSSKEYFEDILDKIIIEYDDKKTIKISDLSLPVTYYTRNGEEKQVGENQTKSSPNIYFTERTSIVRDLMIDNRGSSVLVMKEPFDSEGYSEFDDFLSLNFVDNVLISTPLNSALGKHMLDSNFESSIYACTKKYISNFSIHNIEDNYLSRQLFIQLNNTANRNLNKCTISDGVEVELYKEFRKKLKYLNWNDSRKNDFQRMAFSLLKLFTSSFFSMSDMETALSSERINTNVQSPDEKISELESMIESSPNEDCTWIVNRLKEMYEKFFNSNPKGKKLKELIELHNDKKILIVVPKLYYIDMLNLSDILIGENVYCTTVDRFDPNQIYDIIIAVSNIEGKKFNPVNCSSAKDIYVLLYDCEKWIYDLLSKKSIALNKKIEARAEGKTYQEIEKEMSDGLSASERAEINENNELDNFLNALSIPDVSRIVKNSSYATSGNTQTIDAYYVGSFASGENILFTKYYRAVVFNQETGAVEEKPVESLADGDLLIFVKKDEYTKNIVDFLFDSLSNSGKLSDAILDAYKMSQYWKIALIKFKEEHHFTYRRLTYEFQKLGSSLREVTIRQWLLEDSHIVGPRDLITMERIAKLTKDEKLLPNPQVYFEACKTIRAQRMEILKLISLAINDRLSGNSPQQGSILEVVYDNVEKLSEILELEKIVELPEAKNVNSNIVNKPLTQ